MIRIKLNVTIDDGISALICIRRGIETTTDLAQVSMSGTGWKGRFEQSIVIIPQWLVEKKRFMQ